MIFLLTKTKCHTIGVCSTVCGAGISWQNAHLHTTCSLVQWNSRDFGTLWRTPYVCWQPKLAPTGLTERSDRSRYYDLSGRDRPVWPVGPTGLTGPSRVRVQLGFFIDLDLVIGFLAGQVHPPYKYKGPRPIETYNRSKYINTLLFFMFITFTFVSKP